MITFFSACSYQLEGTNPSLPLGATSLALAPVQNATYYSGLETRLARSIKQMLRDNSSVRLGEVQDSDLILNINLQALDTKQASLSADGRTVELQLSLNGNVVLNDRKQSKQIWRESSIMANTTLSYEKGEESVGLTSSTMKRGLDEVTEAFAKRIYERVFYNF